MKWLHPLTFKFVGSLAPSNAGHWHKPLWTFIGCISSVYPLMNSWFQSESLLGVCGRFVIDRWYDKLNVCRLRIYKNFKHPRVWVNINTLLLVVRNQVQSKQFRSVVTMKERKLIVHSNIYNGLIVNVDYVLVLT